jgi:hypothetical protein
VDIRSAWHNLSTGIRNVVRYAPVIWSDRDWDHYYLLKLLEFKFRNMAVACGDEGHHVNSDREGRQLRVCAHLVKRIREDDYFKNLAGPIEYRRSGKVLSTYRTHLRTRRFGYISPVHRNGIAVTWNEYKRLHDQAEKQKHDDLALLTTMIRRHLLTWWD